METVNLALWDRYLNPIDYAAGFSRVPQEDVEIFALFFEAQQYFGVKPLSLNTVGIFNLCSNFTTAMAVRGLLHPDGRIDHLEHTIRTSCTWLRSLAMRRFSIVVMSTATSRCFTRLGRLNSTTP